jgi:hypothetical protein
MLIREGTYIDIPEAQINFLLTRSPPLSSKKSRKTTFMPISWRYASKTPSFIKIKR